MNQSVISPDYPYSSHYAEVLGSKMHYIEQGSGDPILFLHGVPTSSYLWRNVIPHLSTLGRCIAIDFIGFGQSDKPDIDYSIADHIRFLEAFIASLNLKNITLIMHGWGSIIGLDYAMRHENNCKGLIFYESYLHPITSHDFSLPLQEQLKILNDNTLNIMTHASQLINKIIQQGMTRALSKKELEEYLRPFQPNNSGKPLLKYLQELPKDHNSTNQIITHYSNKLQKSKLPKLLLYSIPGFITTMTTVMWAKKCLPHLEIIDIGEALHYAQENDPTTMGESISIWLQGLEQSTITGN